MFFRFHTSGQCSIKVDNLRSLFREHGRATERKLEKVLERLYYIEYKLAYLVYYAPWGPTGEEAGSLKTWSRNVLELSDDEEIEDVMETDDE